MDGLPIAYALSRSMMDCRSCQTDSAACAAVAPLCSMVRARHGVPRHLGSEFLWRERPAFAAQFTRSNGGVIATRHCDNSGRTCRFSASVTHA